MGRNQATGKPFFDSHIHIFCLRVQILEPKRRQVWGFRCFETNASKVCQRKSAISRLPHVFVGVMLLTLAWGVKAGDTVLAGKKVMVLKLTFGAL